MDELLLAKLLGSLRWKASHIFFNHQTAQAKSVEDDIEVLEHMGHSGDFGNTAKMVGKISKSVMQLISIRF